MRAFGLDVLRVIAVSSVVVSHSWLFTTLSPDLIVLDHFAGFEGVELFFALSGFLIGGILFRKKLSSARDLGTFYGRRWMRTIPAFAVIFIILSIESNASTFDKVKVGTFTGNLLPFQTTHPLAFFPVSWTLAIEEWFYLLVPLALLFFGTRLRTVAILWCAMITARLAWSIFHSDTTYDVLHSTVLLRFDALIAGVFMAGLIATKGPEFLNRNRKWVRVGYGVGLTFMISSWTLLPWIQYNSVAYATIALPLNSLLLALLVMDIGTISTNRDREVQAPRGIVTRSLMRSVTAIALVSYSIYLYHLEIIKFLRAQPSVSGPTFYLLLVALILIVAAASYWIIEKPFMRLRDKILKQN